VVYEDVKMNVEIKNIIGNWNLACVHNLRRDFQMPHPAKGNAGQANQARFLK